MSCDPGTTDAISTSVYLSSGTQLLLVGLGRNSSSSGVKPSWISSVRLLARFRRAFSGGVDVFDTDLKGDEALDVDFVGEDSGEKKDCMQGNWDGETLLAIFAPGQDYAVAELLYMGYGRTFTDTYCDARACRHEVTKITSSRLEVPLCLF